MSSPLSAIYRPLRRFGQRRRNAFEHWLEAKSLVPGREIIPSAAFPWVAALEANWQTIRRELENVMPSRADLPDMQVLSPTQYNVVREKVWKVFAFRAYGSRSEANCRLCPETTRLIDTIPDLEVAFFSILEPGAHLAAHKGSYKGLIRAHLGLIVPEPRAQVRMRVGSEMVHWQEGQCVVFDDTYKHEVWNDTDGARAVLLIDVVRPFPPAIDRINRAILRSARVMPFVTAGLKRLRAWEKQFHGAQPERAP